MSAPNSIPNASTSDSESPHPLFEQPPARSSTDAEFEQSVCRVLNVSFLSQLQAAGCTGLAAVVLFSLASLFIHPTWSLLFWSGSMILLYGGRYVWLDWLIKTNPDIVDHRSTLWKIHGTVLITGAGWGIAAVVIDWSRTPETQLSFLIIMTLVLMASGLILSARPSAGVSFMLPLYIGILIHLNVDRGDPDLSTSLVLGIATFFSFALSRESYRMTRKSARLRLEKEALVDGLVDAKDDAERVAEAKSEFLATMSHEIRNPINALVGMLEVLGDTPLSNTQASYLQTAKRSTDALLQLLNNVLDFSKMEVDKLELEKTPFDWTDLVGEIAITNRMLAQKKGLAFELHLPSDCPPIVVGDPVRLRQILLNLLSNALRFTDDGYIHFRISRVHEDEGSLALSFTVEDSGIGIDPSARKFLFERFRQVHPSQSKHQGGSGLGLSISRKLAELMEGEIAVVSQPGHGSTFVLTVSFQKLTSKSVDRKTDDGEGRDQMEVLLVEDDSISKMVAGLLLKSLGIVATVVDRGQLAIELAKEKDFDLIFMDCKLPDIDGFEAARKISELRKASGKPFTIIALTAMDTPEYRRKAKESGMQGFIAKPIRKRDLEKFL